MLPQNPFRQQRSVVLLYHMKKKLSTSSQTLLHKSRSLVFLKVDNNTRAIVIITTTKQSGLFGYSHKYQYIISASSSPSERNPIRSKPQQEMVHPRIIFPSCFMYLHDNNDDDNNGIKCKLTKNCFLCVNTSDLLPD